MPEPSQNDSAHLPQRGDDRYHLLFQLSPSGLLLEDAEGTILEVNPALCTALGYTRDELVGRNVETLAHEAIKDTVKENIRRILDGETLRHTIRSSRKDGEECFMVLNESRISLPNGEPGIIVASVDITSQVRAERLLQESEAKFRSLADTAPVLIWVAGPDKKCAYFNRTWLEFTGRSANEEMGNGWMQGIYPDDLASYISMYFGSFDSRREFKAEFRLRTRHGEYRWILQRAVPSFSAEGDFAGYIACCTDISERKETETMMRRAKEAAEAATRTKSDFLANMSHEIRTPLNGVLGILQILQSERLTRQQQDYVLTATSSGQALLNVINDILDFSKIEAGRMDLESLDTPLRDLAEETAQMMAPLARAKGLELFVRVDQNLPAIVKGDPARLRQIIVNLLSNAIKFTAAGHIDFELKCADPANSPGAVRFLVRDTGIGIPRNRMDKLFQSFSQGDASTTRQFGGTGLGLAICRRLVSLMGGDITASSIVGTGSEFSFTVSFKVDEQPTLAAIAGGEAALRNVCVLIIDQNEESRSSLVALLKAQGVTSKEAQDAAAGLHALADLCQAPSLMPIVLADSRSLGLKAETFARRVRQNPQTAQTPLILSVPIDEVSTAATLTPWPYAASITKPVRFSKLLEALVEASRCVIGARPPRAKKSDAPARENGSKPSQYRILVVEDNPVNQLVAVRLLGRVGYQTEVSDGGTGAIERLRAGEHYDLVLMDCMMPDLDGYETTRRIRSEIAGGDRLPIVAMTASALAGDREKCLDAGMDDYISKPIKIDEFTRIIEKWLTTGEAQQRLARTVKN